MAALMQTLGPVSTNKSISCNWRFLRSLTAKQFETAATELNRLGLGKMVTINPGRGQHQLVFVKNRPEEVQEVLEANPDLCRYDVYAARFRKQSPKTIGLKVRFKLVEMGLVSQKQFL